MVNACCAVFDITSKMNEVSEDLQNCSTHRLSSKQLHSVKENKLPVHWQSSFDSVATVTEVMEREESQEAFFSRTDVLAV